MDMWSKPGSCCPVLVEACRFGGLSKVCPRLVGEGYYLGAGIRRHDAKLVPAAACLDSYVMHVVV